MSWLAVGLGAAVGAWLRHGVAQGLGLWFGSQRWPWATWLVNVLGSALLVGVHASLAERRWLGVELRLWLGTGLCGALTTYSTLNAELLAGLQAQRWAWAAGYLSATALGALAAGLLMSWWLR